MTAGTGMGSYSRCGWGRTRCCFNRSGRPTRSSLESQPPLLQNSWSPCSTAQAIAETAHCFVSNARRRPKAERFCPGRLGDQPLLHPEVSDLWPNSSARLFFAYKAGRLSTIVNARYFMDCGVFGFRRLCRGRAGLLFEMALVLPIACACTLISIGLV